MKNLSFTILSMIASLALLVILQVFWIKSSYEKAFGDLQRDADIAFRSTIFTLRDSMYSRSVEVVKDSIDTIPSDSVSTFTWKNFVKKDSGTTQIQVFSTQSRFTDTINKNVVKAVLPRLRRDNIPGKSNFIIRLGPDTLNRDSIQYHYQQALREQEIDLPVRIFHWSGEDDLVFDGRQNFKAVRLNHETGISDQKIRPHILVDTFMTDRVRLNPLNGYAASLWNVRSFLLMKIVPQILFSVFLTSITTLSFLLLYHNIRTQRRLIEMKNDFIGNVTHELKTPVATVSVALEAMKNFHALDNPALTKEYLEIAQAEVKRLSQITERILSISLEGHEQEEFKPIHVDMDDVIGKVLKSLRLVVNNFNGTIRYVKAGSEFIILGEPDHITNLVSNLLENALKYGGVRPDVVVTLSDEQNKVRLSIRDHGIGIPAEYHEKIFEKFFRVPTGNIHNIKGYGLGLSYVAEVVKRHKGRIQLASKLNEGSEFILTLPKSTGNADT